ncbi:MAG: thiamine-phosphate kinase, partial [Mariprofundaceae bacterium]|nr:thiamine-phosphate kinase [Mariprofundaceae bacterium]
WLCGELGLAAEALHCWQQGDQSTAVMQAFGEVQPRFVDGIRLREAGVRCCIDVSDGLLADATHLAEDSGVGMQFELSPIASFGTLAQRLNTQDAANLVLAGGEDYALLCTAPAGLREKLSEFAVCIGCCTKQQGVQVLLHGETITAEKRGYDHFN